MELSFWAKRFREQLPHFRELGIQMALDATHKISSSDYKFFALGFLAMHIGKKARLDVFPLNPKPKSTKPEPSIRRLKEGLDLYSLNPEPTLRRRSWRRHLFRCPSHWRL